MKTAHLLKSCLVAASVAFAATASAVPLRIDVAPWAPPAPVDPSSAGDANVIAWLQAVVDSFNALNGPGAPLPTVGATAVQASNNGVDPDGAGPFPGYGTGTLSLSLPLSSYTYLALRWGGGQDGDNWQAFYIGAETGSFTFNAPGQNGLSDYRLYNARTSTAVPDGGSGALLLGSALLSIGLIKRRLAKKH
jgi:hypothetical protein